jgi:hypothetical protein
MMYLITGYKRSGKDTVADYIAGQYKAEKKSLAEPLKETLRTLFNWSRAHTDGHLKEIVDPVWKISPRQAMQVFGTEIMQESWGWNLPEFEKAIGRSFWCMKLLDTTKAGTDYVISDVRFPHEVEFFKKHIKDVMVIRVTRASATGDGHSSETSIDYILPDYVLDNSGSIEDIYRGVDLIIEDVKNKGLVKEE